MHVLLAGRSAERLTVCRKHSHPCWEIVIPLQSRGVVRTHGETVSFSAGSAYVMPPHMEHWVNGDGEISDIYIHVDTLFFAGDRITCVHGLEQFPVLATLLYTLYQKRSPEQQGALNSALVLIVDLIRDMLQEQKSADISTLIRDYLVRNLSDPSLDMARLSAHFGYSSDHIRRVFCQMQGYSPMQFLTQQRLGHAQTLLAQMPFYTIGQIAEECGYADRFYFSRCFCKHTGLSPTKYRQLHGTKN